MNHLQLISKIMILGLLGAMAFTGVAVSAGSRNDGSSLSRVETEMLEYMREEEKLARDVYLMMFDQWGTAIFSNIAASEQQHMDTMLKILDKYKLDDPASEETGIFTDLYLQEKYGELVAKGEESYIDALWVGATIEEIDMVDIQDAIEITNNNDIINVYQSLLDGSENHLRAFVGNLEELGITYEPQFLEPETFEAIMGQ